MKKPQARLWSILLVCAMLLTLLPVTAFAEEDSQATTDAASEGDVSANEEGEGNGEAPEATDAEAQAGDVKYAAFEEAVAAVSEDGGEITLLKDAVISEQVSLPANVTINGNGNTISTEGEWSADDSYKYMLLANAENVCIKNITIDAGGNASCGIQFYASVGGSLEDVTIKNARQLGLNVNASQVTASGELAYEGNDEVTA